MKSVGRNVSNLLVLVAIVACGYYYRDSITKASGVIKDAIFPAKPCENPIPYAIGQFDSSFGLSKADFLKDITQAEVIWDKAVGKKLFTYSTDADLKIHLIYDYRQKATTELVQVNDVIKSDKATYDRFKAQYDSLLITYKQEKADIDLAVLNHQSSADAYEQQVAYWNANGGAPRDEYKKLESERQVLNDQVNSINQSKATFNSLVENINNSASTLNKLASSLNINVGTYNTIGLSTGEEFNEGEYVSNSEGQSITIYQYENTTKLVRVLAHELGHALGLNHVMDPKAIMYRLNQSSSLQLTADDISALKTLCKIK